MSTLPARRFDASELDVHLELQLPAGVLHVEQEDLRPWVQVPIRRSKTSRVPRPAYSMFWNDDGSPESITRGEMYAVTSNGGAPGSSVKSAVWSWVHGDRGERGDVACVRHLDCDFAGETIELVAPIFVGRGLAPGSRARERWRAAPRSGCYGPRRTE